MIINNSGSGFTDVNFNLGFGVGANYQQKDVVSNLDFDQPDLDPFPWHVPAWFALTDPTPNWIGWTQGFMPNGMQASFWYMVDVPDSNDPGIPESAKTGNGYKFTIRVLVENLGAPGGLPLTASDPLVSLMASTGPDLGNDVSKDITTPITSISNLLRPLTTDGGATIDSSLLYAVDRLWAAEVTDWVTLGSDPIMRDYQLWALDQYFSDVLTVALM